MRSCFYRSTDGLDLHALHWRSQDAASSSCVLLLHGFTNDAHVWDPIAEALSRSHHVLALDFRGHGDSAWDSNRRYSHWQLADDVAQAVAQFSSKELDVEQWHVVGHSLGARVAMLALADGTLAVESFVAVDAAPEVSAEASAKILADAQSVPTEFKSIEEYKSYLNGLYALADSAAIERLGQFGLRRKGLGYRVKTDPAFASRLWHQSEEMRAEEEARGPLVQRLWDAVSSIDTPTLVLRGQASAVLTQPAAQALVSNTLSNGSLETVGRSGHALMIDNPSECQRFIAAFLHSHSVASQSIRRAS